MKKVELYQPRDFGTIIADTINFIKFNFKLLIKNIAIFSLPFFILSSIFQTYSGIQNFSQNIFAGGENLNSMFIFYSLGMFFQIIGYTTAAASVLGIMKLYNGKKAGENISSGEVYEEVKDLFFPVIGLSILVFILLIPAFILLVIPGIYFAVALSLTIPAFVNEREGFMEAIGKSRRLIKEKWWFTFGVLIVLFIIAYSIQMIFAVPQTIALLLTSLHSLNLIEQGMPSILMLLLGMISMVGLAFSNIVIYVSLGLIYYSFKEEKEGVNLMLKVNQFGENSEGSLTA